MSKQNAATGQPTAELAAAAAELATGRQPTVLRRFPTGAAHYVFEARFADDSAIVIRMGEAGQREEMRHGLRLVQRLRALGVPHPEMLAEGLDQPVPWVAMRRLPGTDLGHVMHGLSDRQLRDVAARVAEAQRIVSRSGSAGRYGYAASADAAPHATWSAVLDASVARSRRRICSAGLFPSRVVDEVAGLVERLRPELDALPAVPFLHDTTTRNVIVAPDGGFSGIVDIDDLCFGDPRYAAALTLAVVRVYGGPACYVPAWMAAGGHREDRLFRLYVAVFLVDLMSEHGQRFNGNEPASDAASRRALLQVFSEQLANAAL